MSNRPLADDFEEQENERSLMGIMPTAQATLEQLKRFRDVTVYGFLLNPDPTRPLAQVMRERWTEIHHLTGERVMIVATEVPDKWSDNLKEYWKNKLGTDYGKVWQEWQRRPDAGVAFQYMDLFSPHLDQSQLPCLVLFTNPEELRAVVRPLPDWDADSLFHLLRNLLGAIRKCAEQPDEAKRLECLEHSLTSPVALVSADLDYMKDKAVDYIKHHPAQVMTTTIGFVLALATGNVLALSPVAVTILKAVKDAVS